MNNSYRQIIRSSSIIGGASFVNIVVGLLRMKVAAILLGPGGVGLIGLYTNLVATATVLAGGGVGTVGTRQIAEAVGQENPQSVWLVRRSLLWLTLGLATFGGGAFWLLRNLLAARVLNDPSLSGALGWLSIAVGLSIAAASQTALLRGMRCVGDVARVSVGSAALSTGAAICVLWLWGKDGIVAYVLLTPISGFLLGHLFVSRLPKVGRNTVNLDEISDQCRKMLRLGFMFMVGGLAGTIGQLAVRALVQRELGVDALGHFQAGWAISMTYIGFVLGAMVTDYYPRLTAVINDHAAVNKLVNEQTEVGLLLAAPILLAMLGLSPWVMRALYSAEFVDAANILRWQVLGDILKVVSWPLGFILAASGAGKTFMGTQWLVMAVFFSLSYLFIPIMGVSATGVAFLGMYAFNLALVWRLAVRRTNFTWEKRVRSYASALFASGIIIVLLSRISALAAEIIGILSAIGWGVFALTHLAHETNLTGQAGKVASMARSVMTKAGIWRD